MKQQLQVTFILIAISLSGIAQAALFNRGSGLIYDDVLDVTWLQDANAGAGSSFDDGSSNTDGRMTWNNAVAWADDLSFGGFDDWRLPTLSPIDGSGSFKTRFSNNATTDIGYAKTGTGWVDGSGDPVSEMGYMYYVNLMNLGFCTPNDASSTSCAVQSGFGLSNTGLFTNLETFVYWSGVEFALNPTSLAWDFSTRNGNQNLNDKNNQFHAWAVRSGDVTASSVPEPASIWLIGSALIGFVGLRRKR